MTADEITTCIRKLEPIYTVPEALRWMAAPQPLLENRRPLDCELDDVLAVIERLESGAYL